MQKILATFLLAVSTLTVCGADPALTLKGSGTENDPWQISTKDDVVQLAKACQSGTNGATSGHYEGKFFKMTADIDMSGVTDFYGIGTAPISMTSGTAYYFGGNFDGGGYRIKNLKICAAKFDATTGIIISKITANNSRANTGFFGTLKNATVKNLTIDKSCDYIGYSNMGGIAGRIEEGTGKTTVSNCVNEATIHAYDNSVGGIIGYVYRYKFTSGEILIENCFNKGNIYSTGQYAGGIIGRGDRLHMRNCMNIGRITGGLFDNKSDDTAIGQSYYGGIAGSITGMVMTDVMNAGPVTNTSDYCGGIAGTMQSQKDDTDKNNIDTVGSITKCVNTGTVMSPALVLKGAITGCNGYGSKLTYPVEFSSVYYDAQLNGLAGNAAGEGVTTGINGLATGVLTNGNAQEGLGQEWKFRKGFYPTLQSFQGEATDAAAASYFVMPQGMTTSDFSGEATLSTSLAGMNFKMAKGEYIKIANGKITLAATKAIVKDTVIVSKGDFQTRIPMRHIPGQIFEGKGTATEPYLLSTKTDLMNLAETVNGLLKHFDNTYFKMTADIDLGGDQNFKGIGVHPGRKPEETYWFAGIFDGAGHTVSNFKAEYEMYNASDKAITAAGGAYESLGFFGTLGETAVVKNLNLDQTCSIIGSAHIGGIAGRMLVGAQIDNCSFAGVVKAQGGYVGGIAGSMESAGDGTYTSAIRNCVFSGEVNSDHQYGGGIAGYSKSLIENCASAGIVKSFMFKTTSTFLSNHNNIGGIAGYNAGEMRNCANYSDVEAHNNVGGIVGTINTYYKGGKVENCFNSGIISCTAGQEASSGAFMGNRMTSSNPEAGVCRANYTERQLTILKPYHNGDFSGIHEISTDTLTSGTAIDSLAQGFVFTKGYYPMPKGVAGNEAVKRAAAVFFSLTAPQTLTGIQSAAPINNAVKLTAKLKDGSIFKIDGTRLVPGFSEEVVTDTLTLSAGNFAKTYPISKLPSFLKGEGTKSSPWLVETVKDMNKIADFSTISMRTYNGEYFRLMKDLDYTGATLNPIGTITKFEGEFDGNGHVIKNMKVESTDSTRHSYIGIFAQTTKESTVKNLTISAAHLVGSGYVGTIAAHLGGRIENCKADDKCVIEGKWFERTDENNGQYIGGLIGEANRTSVILNCENRAKVTGHKYVGGIAGYIYTASDKGTAVIDNCVNYGAITGTATPIENVTQTTVAGGVVGYLSGKISGLKNYGTVTAGEANGVGGIAGAISKRTDLSESYNYGEVSSARSCVGGIVGYIPIQAGNIAPAVVRDCGNFGKVSGAMYTGGLVGQGSSSAMIVSSFNDGAVKASVNTAGGVVGGVVGLSGQSLKIEKCYNTAKIEAPLKVAGIAGFSNELSKNGISKCFNLGEISQTIRTDSTNSCGAGIANGSFAIDNSYNAGKVNGWNYVGGIAGRLIDAPDTVVKITRCYNIGEIITNNENNGTRVGNICGTKTGQVGRSCSINTFKTYTNDESWNVEMLTPFALTEKNIGPSFVMNPLCFPMIAGIDTVEAAKAYAAYFKAPAANDKGNIDYYIELSKLAGVTWTSNNLLKITGDKAEPVSAGEAELTANCGKFSKSWLLKVDKFNSIGEIEAEEVVSKQYYTPNGMMTTEPQPGLNIVVYTTASGKRITRKVMIRK